MAARPTWVMAPLGTFPAPRAHLRGVVSGYDPTPMGVASISNVRRLLVISYHFPPDGAIGGQRWAGLSKYLARMGWEVHVVTASTPDGQPVIPGVHRHVRHRRRTLNDVYKSAADRLRQTRNTSGHVPTGSPTPPKRFSPLRPVAAVRKVVAGCMYFPDFGRGWVVRAAEAARSLLREKEFDVVITSGPPHSTHFAGALATRGRNTQLWIDMRDPWSTTHKNHLPEDWMIRSERFFLRGLERLVFPRATRVIANTREFASVLKGYEPKLDVRWFPNGIDLEQLPPRDASTVEPGSIAYVGSLYLKESLSSVFSAMQALLRDRPEAATTLRLHVAGSVDSPNREQMEAEIAAAGLASLVTIHGVVPRDQALELLRRSQLALVLAQGLPVSVPAKLYESVGLGVPTLVIGEEACAAVREARRIGAMTIDDGDVEGMRLIMDDMLDGRMPVRIDPQTPISYEALAVKMDGLLQGVVVA
jgi:glycosyltransferase involved in cell wall biosynthesis